MSSKILTIGVPVAGLLIATVALGIDILQIIPVRMIEQESRFSCNLENDINRGGEVWTIKYSAKGKSQPWVKLTTTLGDDWNPSKRCDVIADRLEMFRKDGLIAITYRDDPNTPNQEVICVKTRRSANNCPLLLTLNVGVDGYKSSVEMFNSLLDGSSVYQNTDEKVVQNFTPEKPIIYLDNFLAEDDR